MDIIMKTAFFLRRETNRNTGAPEGPCIIKKMVFQILCTCQQGVVWILIFTHNLSGKAYSQKFNSSVKASCQVSAENYAGTLATQGVLKYLQW